MLAYHPPEEIAALAFGAFSVYVLHPFLRIFGFSRDADVFVLVVVAATPRPFNYITGALHTKPLPFSLVRHFRLP